MILLNLSLQHFPSFYESLAKNQTLPRILLKSLHNSFILVFLHPKLLLSSLFSRNQNPMGSNSSKGASLKQFWAEQSKFLKPSFSIVLRSTYFYRQQWDEDKEGCRTSSELKEKNFGRTNDNETTQQCTCSAWMEKSNILVKVIFNS